MRSREPDEASFLKDVAAHQMQVLRNDGVYRHIRFRRPDSYCMGFDLVTWPGYLAYSGDMGEYMFSRINDMFEFFRDKPEGPLRINAHYWAEKCRASQGDHGVKVYSPDKFREVIEDWLNRDEPSQELRDAVEDEVLSQADDGIYPAMRAAMDFQHAGRHWFTDFWEADPTEYSYHFVWCCYALAWGIRQYDAASRVPTALSA